MNGYIRLAQLCNTLERWGCDGLRGHDGRNWKMFIYDIDARGYSANQSCIENVVHALLPTLYTALAELRNDSKDTQDESEADPIEADPINHPDHYEGDGMEVKDVLEAFLTPEQLEGFRRGNAIKYLLRYPKKGGAQDIGKADWYVRALMGEPGN